MTMRISVTRVRRVYEKLTITAYIKAATSGVGLTQWVKDGVYSPNHSVTPLVLSVSCTATATDLTPEQVFSVGAQGGVAGDGSTAWLVNGEAISTVWTAGTDYEFQQSGKELWIYRNLTAAEKASISVWLQVYDGRMGLTIPFLTDAIDLATVEIADSPMRLSTDRNSVIWDVTADDLWEWEYRAARGYTQKMTEVEATNDACYKKTVNVCVTQGKRITAGYGLTLKDADGNEVARIEAADDEATVTNGVKVLALTRAAVTFDCRLIDDELFTLTALDADGAEVKSCVAQLHVKSRRRDYDAPEIVNYSEYTVRQKSYRNELRVRINGEELEYPECWLYILWKTLANTDGAEEVEVGVGDTCAFAPNEAGGGVTAEDNGFQMIADTDYHALLQPATDGESLVADEKGNVLLI